MTEWVITRQAEMFQYEPLIGVQGPSGGKMSRQEIEDHPDHVLWNCYDDDGIFYAGGYLVGDDLFAPLDNFCQPSLGCTTMKIYKEGKWEVV